MIADVENAIGQAIIWLIALFIAALASVGIFFAVSLLLTPLAALLGAIWRKARKQTTSRTSCPR